MVLVDAYTDLTFVIRYLQMVIYYYGIHSTDAGSSGTFFNDK